MLPNFESDVVFPKLRPLVREWDLLLLSANLAPGSDYAAGIKRVLPLYDNLLTREWLMMFLNDLGVEKEDGHLKFCIEDSASEPGLKRIAAYFKFRRKWKIKLEERMFVFQKGEKIRLFFSYRHTSELMHGLLKKARLRSSQAWISKSEEEEVFLVTSE